MEPEPTPSSDVKTVPKYVFIVPYRDREPHRVFFNTYIYKVMEDVPPEDWMFYFVHQNDKRPFNRGAMKNIGFLALKTAYPDDYKNIIFIFNDVDTLPYDKNVLNYHTEYGVIKHFYGFHFALGGIFSVRGVDFERINGFPNYWAWGGEDNLIHERAKNTGLIIDRSNFFTIGNMNILQFADGIKRLICRDELATSIMKDHADGITTVKNLNYIIYADTHMIDVTSFDTLISPYQLKFEEQTLDKVSKIRVSPKNAINNIKELKTRYFLESNGMNYNSTNPGMAMAMAQNHPSMFTQGQGQGQGSRVTTPSYNAINHMIQPELPFNTNLQNRRPRDFGAFLPQQYSGKVDTAAAAAAAAAATVVGSTKVYQVNKQTQNVVIPLQRPASTGTAPNIHQQKRFGMRARFM
jgi:hypothetical protein